MNWVAWDKVISPGVCLMPGKDSVSWLYDSSGAFSVASVKGKMLRNSSSNSEHVFVWNKLVPKKVGFVTWRAVLGRLPTLDALVRRKLPVSSTLCPICGEVEESIEHVFVSCGIAQTMWSVISLWCKLPAIFLFSFQDVVNPHKFSAFPKEKAKVFQAVCLIATWCLWKRRNALVHSGTLIHVTSLVEEIKIMGFLWIKNRGKKGDLSWEDWCSFRL
ncbi:uncharacterized protein LOC143637516 [Bidens hawaiensis]|uniref:uncharacterized protein LOC143637516 n=1 Tax=Bidens hawaiensis TaxID=980011 RepID=UPI00404B5870